MYRLLILLLYNSESNVNEQRFLSPSIGCLFIWLTISTAVQKQLESCSENACLCLYLKVFLPTFPLIISEFWGLTLRTLVHLESFFILFCFYVWFLLCFYSFFFFLLVTVLSSLGSSSQPETCYIDQTDLNSQRSSKPRTILHKGLWAPWVSLSLAALEGVPTPRDDCTVRQLWGGKEFLLFLLIFTCL